MEKVTRFLDLPDQSFFLLGPRGTGKSTFIKDAYPDALYIDLLLPDVNRRYSAKPERLKEIVKAHPDTGIVIIDEIQTIPALLGVVHSLIEENKNVQYILTGSSARKLKRTGVNLLAGRALLRKMHPFSAAELKGAFSLDNALRQGLVPVIVDSGNPTDSLNAYIDLYMREEVQMEGLTRNIGNFTRFLEQASFSHASLLSYSSIARDCGIERKTVESYIIILEDLLLAFRLPIFQKRAKRAVTQHPKFYFFDCGIYRTVRPSGPLDRPEEIGGPALEGLVAQNIRAWIDQFNKSCSLYYWRTQAGSEVDFIIYGKDRFTALEVKNTDTIRPQDLRGLQSFAKEYPEAEKILLYRGDERLVRDDILIQPCVEFLLSLGA